MQKTQRVFFCSLAMIFLLGWNYPNKIYDAGLHYTIIAFNRLEWVFEDIKKAALSKKELEQTFQTLRETVRDYNQTISNKSDTIPDLSIYKIQLLPFRYKNGQKYVGVICLCKVVDNEDTQWKEDVILESQSNSTCYFKFIINLSKSSHTPLSFKQYFDELE